MSAEAAHLQCLNRKLQIIDRARRRGEMNDCIQPFRNVKVLCDILLDEFEPLVSQMMRDVLHPSGQKVVEHNNLIVAIQKPVRQMRAKEARSSCYQDPH